MIHAAFVTLACGALSARRPDTLRHQPLGQSLSDDAFLDFVLAEIEATGIAPERIFFEITETAAIGNLTKASRFISALKELGFRFVARRLRQRPLLLRLPQEPPGRLPEDRRQLRAQCDP